MKTVPLSRRAFLRSAAAAAAVTQMRAEKGISLQKRLAADPLRPQCHLMPPGNWMNDPNGPIVWNGKIHLFYQVNPEGADWGDISWGHAVSPDMVHWRNLPIAMEPVPGTIYSYGVFSGSCIADGDRCLAFYTAVERSDKEDATLHGDPELREQQAVAISTDKNLLVWDKQSTPLIAKPPLPNIAGFRDPSVWRDGKTWYMTVGSGQIDGNGMVLLYSATVPTGPDANWKYLHPLISAPGNGKHTPDTVDAGTMWECPDFFELDGHHVLLYSTERKVFWMTGRLDRDTMKFEPKVKGLLDSGAYYAPKSMVGPHDERILWGWIPERRTKEQYIAAGWSGVMSFPRVLHVDKDGNLLMAVAPVVDRELLHGAPQTSSSRQIQAHINNLCAKVTAIIPKDGCGFSVNCGKQELLRVRRLAPQQVEINGVTMSAPLGDGVTAYIDGSVIEMFFGDRAAHTLRVYPTLVQKDGLTISALGESSLITAQELQPISNNRMTSGSITPKA